jgi:hypothetical protein
MELVIRDNLEVRTAHADMVRAVELVGKEGRMSPPVGLIDEIVIAYQERPPSRSRAGLLMWLSMVAIVGVIGAGAYYYTRSSGEQVVDISAQRDQVIESEVEVIDTDVVAEQSLAVGDADAVQPVVEALTTSPVVSSSPSIGSADLGASLYDEVGPQTELDLTSTNEWEELWEGAGGREDGLLTVPSSYRFYAVDSGSLGRIASLAHGAGASLVTRSGESFETFRMSTERNFSNFVVRIPSESVESFLGELQLLGSLSVVPSDGVLLSPNGVVELGVQVQYSP